MKGRGWGEEEKAAKNKKNRALPQGSAPPPSGLQRGRQQRRQAKEGRGAKRNDE